MLVTIQIQAFFISLFHFVVGILSGVLDKDTGKRNLLKTLRDKEQYAQCTVSMALYLFRALEMVEAYEETEKRTKRFPGPVRGSGT